jgi:glycosyltransferase involved in cell wall biosynthesis
MMLKLPHKIIHYSEYNPDVVVGGVETFALRLRLVFDEVSMMTPETLDIDRVRRDKTPVICDNQFVRDWPESIPVIGFQHGVGAVKYEATGSFSHWKLKHRQRKAARRSNTLWVSNSQWVSETFNQLHGNGGTHVVYYPVDTDRFDARLGDPESRLILHDGRLKHKGLHRFSILTKAFPDWNFEHLNCKPEDVADRMREARAFAHLSTYEGNSVVCNEAMAMNLPCFLTEVGLFRDKDRPEDVFLIGADTAFRDKKGLVKAFGTFLDSLSERAYNPRSWTMNHATIRHSYKGWKSVMEDFDQNYSWS